MNIVILIVVMILAHLSFAGGRVTLALFAIKLGASPFEVGLLTSLLAAIPMFLSVHTGRWTDRVGVYIPTLISLLMLIAGALLPALVPRLASLYGACILIGSGFMLAHVAINSAVGNLSTPENRKNSFSLLALGFSTSTSLGPVIAGFAIDMAGHVAAFFTLAAFPVVALIVLAGMMRWVPIAPRADTPNGKLHVLDLLAHAPLRTVFIVSGLVSMGWDLFIFMVPIQGARMGLSASTIGLIMGAFGAGTFVVRLAMPRIAHRFSEWQIISGALAITGFVYLLFPLFAAVPVLVALAFVLGLGLGSAFPMILSLIYVVAPAGRTGEAVGVRATLVNASQTILPLMFGALGTVVGTVPVFWSLALVLLSGGVFARRKDTKA